MIYSLETLPMKKVNKKNKNAKKETDATVYELCEKERVN